MPILSLRQNPTFTGIEDLKERKKRGLPTPPPLDAKAKTDGEVLRQGGHRGHDTLRGGKLPNDNTGL